MKQVKIQLSSNNTVVVDTSLTLFVEAEVKRALGRFATRLTRVEIHLSTVEHRSTRRAGKRCLIEARPKGARPRSASANATIMSSAVSAALGKMQRSLTTFFGRRGRPALAIPAPVSAAKKTAASIAAATVAKRRVAVRKQAKLSPRGPKKKGIYRARRQSWPAR